MWFSGFSFSYFVSHSWSIPMVKITGLSHHFKWENLHNWWLTKYFFAPLYVFLKWQYLCLCGVEHMVVGLCQWVWSSPFSCLWFGFASWNWQHIMVHRVRVSIIPFWPWGTTSFGAVSGSGTYVRTRSCRCNMYLTEWSVRSSEDVFRSVGVNGMF